jgi:hypothetical protein
MSKFPHGGTVRRETLVFLAFAVCLLLAIGAFIGAAIVSP